MHIILPHLILDFTKQIFQRSLIVQILKDDSIDIDYFYTKLAFMLGSFILPKQIIKSF